MSLLELVSAQLERWAPQAPGFVVAFSGGLDSTALAHLVIRHSAKTGQRVVLAHVNHQLRSSAALDARHCARFAHRWGVAFTLKEVEVPKGNSTQQHAREQRMLALAHVAREHGLSVVLGAHHQDDLLETALLRLRRGASTRGLGLAMTPCAPLPYAAPGLTLVRPLLEISRAALEAYAHEHELTWVEDPTNATDDYARNSLRHHVMPALLSQHGEREGMLRTLEHLRLEALALERWIEDSARDSARSAPHALARGLDAAKLVQLPQPIAVGVLQRAMRALELEHRQGPMQYEALLALCEQRQDTSISLPQARASLSDGILTIERMSSPQTPEVEQSIALGVSVGLERLCEAAVDLPWFGQRLVLSVRQAHQEDRALSVEALRARGESVICRGALAGERMVVAQGSRKSVKELLRQRGVPTALRWRWPCLADHADELVGIVGGPLRAELVARPGQAALFIELSSGK